MAPKRRRRVRALVALNAGALALLTIAASAFVLNPAPVQYGASLPTYLGARSYVADLRTKLNLREALGAAGAYRAVHGTFAGFTAAAGEAAVHSLAWTDTLPATGDPAEPLRVGIAYASESDVQLVSLSESGRAFCAEAAVVGLVPRPPTYGVGGRPDGEGDDDEAFARAMATCASTPLDTDALRPFPIASLCDGIGDQSLMICRVVQRLLRRTMASAVPSS